MNGSEGRRESPPLMRMPPCGRESGGTKAGLGGMRREGLWLSLSTDMALLRTGAGGSLPRDIWYGQKQSEMVRGDVTPSCWSEINIIVATWKCYLLLCMAAEYTRVAKEKAASTVYIPLLSLLCTVIRLLPVTCGEIETEIQNCNAKPIARKHSLDALSHTWPPLRYSLLCKLRFCLRSPIPPQSPHHIILPVLDD